MNRNKHSKLASGAVPTDQDAARGPQTPKAALAVLAGWVSTMVGPSELRVMPQLVNIAEATDASNNAGVADARSKPFDIYSEAPRLSLEQAILPTLLGVLDLIGIRARDILAACRNGKLTPLPQPTLPAVWYRAISPLTWILLVIGGLIEMWLGAQLWERLISADDSWSWVVGLAWGSVIAAGMVVIARMVWEQRPGLLQERGLVIAFALAAVFGFGLAIYAYALAGGAEPEQSGGIEGGTTTGADVASSGVGVNWIFALVYFGAMAFIAAMLVFAHLRDMSQEAKERRRAKRDAWSQVLSPEDQIRLAIELLEACLALVHQATTVIQALASAYVGGARMTLAPELNSMWNTDRLERLEIAPPAWMGDIRQEIRVLKQRLELPHDEPPALSGAAS
ncbi:hypothetical protein [Nocardioides humi]|uniref:Uncharacterized protein n=1 Tax=Nocardioides humi TaxID=449461 RepID=A0ABN2A0G7_9ACTN|nr:hypothetical protein [Nocardioides humi]